MKKSSTALWWGMIMAEVGSRRGGGVQEDHGGNESRRPSERSQDSPEKWLIQVWGRESEPGGEGIGCLLDISNKVH